jgi:hypothetical protein
LAFASIKSAPAIRRGILFIPMEISMRRACIVICACGLIVNLPVAADAPKLSLKTQKANPPKQLKENFSSLLSDQAVEVTNDSGAAVATFWFRKAIPSKAAPEQVKNGLTYHEIPQTTLIGVVEFAQAWTDYRKQKIPAGAYTLRLAFQPMDGDHQGTAPYGEFCLLTPIGKDEKPDTMDVKDLYELSANAAGGTHPGVMLLYPNSKPEDQPKLESKPNDAVVLLAKLKVDANGTPSALGFGFTVAGVTQQ